MDASPLALLLHVTPMGLLKITACAAVGVMALIVITMVVCDLLAIE